jgi:Txe/YoeB family toxin of Txe-Axe toxin-antitoxin module
MTRAIRFVPDAWDTYLYWQQQDKKTLKRINTLIKGAARDQFQGIKNGSKGSTSTDLSSGCRINQKTTFTATVQTLPVIPARMPGSRCHGWRINVGSPNGYCARRSLEEGEAC